LNLPYEVIYGASKYTIMGKKEKIWSVLLILDLAPEVEWPEVQSCRIYVRAVQKSPRADGSSVLRANELSGKSEMPSLPDSTWIE
jgi:hypothetical protein